MSRGPRAAAAALLALAAAPAARAADPAPVVPASDVSAVRRGPLEIRDEWLLAQPRLTLPALSPDPLPAGKTRLAVDFAWGSDFGWQPGMLADTTDFLVDGEHRTLGFDLRHGLTRSLTVGLRLPVQWRGGGMMDGIIDWFHRVTGLPGGGRPIFPVDRLRVEWRGARRTVRWDTGAGTGLGDTELSGQWAFWRGGPDAAAAALVVRAALPTGTGPFAGGGVDGGVQLVSAWPLHRAVDLYSGVGGTVYSDPTVDGLEYAQWRGHGFLALEWRPGRRWSLGAEVEFSTRLVENLPRYPGWQGYLQLGAVVDVSERWRVHGGFVEGIKNQQATTDFGVVAGFARRF
jgi:hypothetical protein